MVQRATHRIAPQSYGDGAIEEADLSTPMALCSEQFHHAVTDRRAAISASGADLPRVRAR